MSQYCSRLNVAEDTGENHVTPETLRATQPAIPVLSASG